MDTLRIMCDGPKPGQASGVGGPETIASADGSGLASVDRGLPMLTSGRFHWVLERPCEPRSELRECEGGCVPASKTRSIAMTLQEMERGFELHEQRMARIEENLGRVQDNLLVQGELLNRIDQRVERLAAVMAEQGDSLNQLREVAERLAHGAAKQQEALTRLAKVVEEHEERLAGVEERLAAAEDRDALMQSAFTALMQRLDAFIRGRERPNGHPQGGDE